MENIIYRGSIFVTIFFIIVFALMIITAVKVYRNGRKGSAIVYSGIAFAMALLLINNLVTATPMFFMFFILMSLIAAAIIGVGIGIEIKDRKK